MSELDWAPYPGLVLVNRSFTILGAYAEKEKWPVVDMTFVRGRVQLAPGVVFNLSRVVLTRAKYGPPFQNAAFDLIASTNASAHGNAARPIVVAWNAALIWDVCLPSEQATLSMVTWPRPKAQLPGTQSITARVPQSPDCNASAAAAPLKRCWAAVGVDNDIALYGSVMDKYGKQALSGYLVWVVATYFLCEAEMSAECVAEYGNVGCYNVMKGLLDEAGGAAVGGGGGSRMPPPVARLGPSSALDSVATASGGSASGGGGGGGSRPLVAALVGGLLGGAFLVLMSVAALVVGRRRWRRSGGGGGPCIARLLKLNPGAAALCSSDGLDSEALEVAVVGAGSPTQRTELAGHPPWAATHGSGPDVGLGGDDSPPTTPCISYLSGHIPVHDLTGLNTARDTGAKEESLPVTPLTPADPTINLELSLGPNGGLDNDNENAELKLLPTCLGAGAAGRVVLGVYRGQRVAVKLLNAGLLSQQGPSPAAPTGTAAEAAAPPPPQAAAAEARALPEAAGQPPAEPGVAAAPVVEVLVCSDGTTGAGAGAALGAAFGQSEARPLRTGGGGAASGADNDAGRAAETARGSDGAEPPVSSTALTSGSSFGAAADVVSAGQGAAAVAPPQQLLQQLQQQQLLRRGVAVAAAARTFTQEVAVLARCRHPNIVRLLAASLTPPRPCLVMELMDTSLERMLYGAGPTERRLLPLPTVLHIGAQVATALAYLHPTVMHRDLKPANVLISQRESEAPVVKLADFGLSRLRSTVLPTLNPEVGTCQYMAPESFDVRNFIITDRADVYALGVILWEMLSGARPWQGMTAVQVAVAVSMQKSRLPLDGLAPGRCPPKLERLMVACWEHDPARRPAAAEVAKELLLLEEGLDPANHANGGAAPPNANDAATDVGRSGCRE